MKRTRDNSNTIRRHKKLIVVWDRLHREAGDFASKLPKAHFNELAGDECDYSPSIVDRIIDNRSLYEPK